MCLFYSFRPTTITALFWYRVSIARDTLLTTTQSPTEPKCGWKKTATNLEMNHSSIRKWSDTSITSRYETLMADDSNNILLITIQAISLSWRGVRKRPQGTDFPLQTWWQRCSITNTVLRSMTSAKLWIIPRTAIASRLPNSASKHHFVNKVS